MVQFKSGILRSYSILALCMLLSMVTILWVQKSLGWDYFKNFTISGYESHLGNNRKEGLADIVITYCYANISWLNNALREILDGGHSVQRIYIYVLCDGGGDPLSDIGPNFQHEFNNVQVIIKSLPNRGRNDMVYAYHIYSQYDQLNQIESIFFLKDSMTDYPMEKRRKLLVSFQEVSSKLKKQSFVCFQHPDGGLEWHYRQELWKFRLPYYASPYDVSKLSDGYVKANSSMCQFLQGSLELELFDNLRQRDHLPVCYGGSFASRTDQIQKVSIETWKRIYMQLGAEENGEILHFMERSWAFLLSPSETEASALIDGNKTLNDHLYFPHFAGIEKRDYNPGMLVGTDEARGVSHQAINRTNIITAETMDSPDKVNPPILLVAHQFSRTGAPLYLLYIARRLIEAGEKVVVLSPFDGSLSADFRNIGAEVILCEKIRFDLVGWPCTESFCPSPIELILCFVQSRIGSRPEIVFWGTIEWGDILLEATPYCNESPRNIWIIQEWAPEGTSNWSYLKSIKTSLSRKRAVSKVDALVFDSDMARQLWYSSDGIVPFNTIHGFSVYNKDKNVSRGISRASLHIPEEAFVITQVGTIDQRKQQHWGIDAVANLRRRGIDAILLIIGQPMNEYFLNKEILPRQQKLGKDVIRIVPPHADVSRFLLLADLHISSSNMESYPINTLEAMALSVPVVATSAGGTEEQFPTEASWMVSPIDHDSFVDTVYKAAKMSNLTEYGRILYQNSQSHKDMFEESILNLLKTVKKRKADHATCRMLLQCDSWNKSRCEEALQYWDLFHQGKSSEKQIVRKSVS